MKLTREETETLYETRNKIDRLINISHVIERLERISDGSDFTGSEGLRSILHAAVFNLEVGDIKQIVLFVLQKITDAKVRSEVELAGLKTELL